MGRVWRAGTVQQQGAVWLRGRVALQLAVAVVVAAAALRQELVAVDLAACKGLAVGGGALFKPLLGLSAV